MASRPSTAEGAINNVRTPNPFSIEPAEGSIAPKASQTFTVRFIPLEVDTFHYKLNASMPSLPADVEVLQVSLMGQSYRPVCHFEIDENSDYLTTRSAHLRNELGQLGPIEANSLKVVEMSSIGVQTRNVKRFLVMNPTSVSYEFVWEAQGVPSPAWRCLTPKGTILAGKRGEMIFEYTPNEVSVAETFFSFKILGQSRNQGELFLFVGHVVEPQVSLDRVRVELSASILGSATADTFHLVNDEDTPFSFSFDKKLLAPVGSATPSSSSNKKARPILDINPVAGMAPPRSRIPITVTLCPDEEKAYNFNIPLTVRRKPGRLNVNVKGEGYAIHSRLVVADATAGGGASDASVLEIKTKPAVNTIDFGGVHINEKATKILSLTNAGKFNVDYKIEHNLHRNPMIMLSDLMKPQGTLRKGNDVWVYMIEKVLSTDILLLLNVRVL